MNLGAAVGFLLDRRERTGVMEQLRDEACGFRVTRDGAFVWRFALDELPDELAAPSGPAVVLASILGIPFARLRAGLPVRPRMIAECNQTTRHAYDTTSADAAPAARWPGRSVHDRFFVLSREASRLQRRRHGGRGGAA